VSRSVTLQLENLIFKNPENTPAPVCVDYQGAAEQLAPLVARLASGDELSSQQLTTIVLDSWRVIEVARNLLRRADAANPTAQPA
jgi:hypothetical protein